MSLFLLAALPASAFAALVQDTVPTQNAATTRKADNIYDQLVRVLDAAADRDVVFQRSLDDLKAAFITNDANWISLEADHPGALDKTVAAMVPYLRRHEDRVIAQLQSAMADLFAANLTEQEARDAAAFFSSPLGRSFIGSITANFTTRSLVKDAMINNGEGTVTPGAVQQDLVASINAGIADLSPAEIAAINEQVAGSSWGLKMQAVQGQVVAVRTQFANLPMLPAEEKQMEEAVKKAMLEIVGSDRP